MCKEVFKRTSSGLIFGYSEVFGTNQECLFDDFFEYKKLIVPEIGYFPFVSSVKIWHGDVIDGIEFVYDKEYSSKGKSPFFHGGQNGWEDRFELMPGDSIQVVEGEYGRYPFSLEPVQQEKDIIIRLRFITREGKESPWYGNACGKGDKMKGTPFKIDVGRSNVICGLQGAMWKPNMSLHSYIQAIGIIYVTFLDITNFQELVKKE